MYSFNHLEISHPIAFFDLETTGLLSPDARIVEWSVLRFDPRRAADPSDEAMQSGMSDS